MFQSINWQELQSNYLFAVKYILSSSVSDFAESSGSNCPLMVTVFLFSILFNTGFYFKHYAR